ncbi:hypothetical protein L6452_14666 [Arctium lappa]|uniref:Uncharacterized protein n=1 Tax=Arctium lappa TaxID=4217 RepID=A0ACB9CLS9_ARCLA|nr:hypothetical protein L6452_14666 [Arctium lappa]
MDNSDEDWMVEESVFYNGSFAGSGEGFHLKSIGGTGESHGRRRGSDLNSNGNPAKSKETWKFPEVSSPSIAVEENIKGAKSDVHILSDDLAVQSTGLGNLDGFGTIRGPGKHKDHKKDGPTIVGHTHEEENEFKDQGPMENQVMHSQEGNKSSDTGRSNKAKSSKGSHQKAPN